MATEDQEKYTTIPLPNEIERKILLHLLEELGETSHIIFKILRFGFENKGPNEHFTNEVLLHNELTDVAAVMNALSEIGKLNLLIVNDEFRKERKRIKMKRWN